MSVSEEKVKNAKLRKNAKDVDAVINRIRLP
jgi:hypothetical protein